MTSSGRLPGSSGTSSAGGVSRFLSRSRASCGRCWAPSGRTTGQRRPPPSRRGTARIWRDLPSSASRKGRRPGRWSSRRRRSGTWRRGRAGWRSPRMRSCSARESEERIATSSQAERCGARSSTRRAERNTRRTSRSGPEGSSARCPCSRGSRGQRRSSSRGCRAPRSRGGSVRRAAREESRSCRSGRRDRQRPEPDESRDAPQDQGALLEGSGRQHE